MAGGCPSNLGFVDDRCQHVVYDVNISLDAVVVVRVTRVGRDFTQTVELSRSEEEVREQVNAVVGLEAD